MPHPYVSFDPAAQVNGETLQALSVAFHVKEAASLLLQKHGLPSQPENGEWYPMQAWLDLLAELEKSYGAHTVYAVGLQVITSSKWPQHIFSLSEALYALDEACRINIQGSAIGYYQVQEIAPREMRVVCLTPTPPDFECGIITGLARRFKPFGSLRVQIDKETPSGDAHPLLKWFRVRW